MSKKCNCGSSYLCNKVTIKDKVFIEKVFIGVKAKNLVTCMKYLENYCKEKDYEMIGDTLNYRTIDGDKVELNLYAKKIINLENK